MKSNLNQIKKLGTPSKRSNKTLAELHAELLAIGNKKVRTEKEITESVIHYANILTGKNRSNSGDSREFANNLLELFKNDKSSARSVALEILKEEEEALMEVLAIIEYSDWHAI
jgi:ubiquitin C-terminal hydrolase